MGLVPSPNPPIYEVGELIVVRKCKYISGGVLWGDRYVGTEGTGA